MDIQKYGDRNWGVYDNDGNLVCVTVYKKGAIEVVNRLSGENTSLYIPPAINLKELSRLQKDLVAINRKLRCVLQEIKSGNKLNEAVL